MNRRSDDEDDNDNVMAMGPERWRGEEPGWWGGSLWTATFSLKHESRASVEAERGRTVWVKRQNGLQNRFHGACCAAESGLAKTERTVSVVYNSLQQWHWGGRRGESRGVSDKEETVQGQSSEVQYECLPLEAAEELPGVRGGWPPARIEGGGWELIKGSPGGSESKESPAMQETGVR